MLERFSLLLLMQVKMIRFGGRNINLKVKVFRISEADAAQSALNNRWFGGRSIQADIYDEDKYQAQDYSG